MPATEEKSVGNKTAQKTYQLPEAFASSMAAGRSVFAQMLVNQIRKGETKLSDIPEEGILGVMEFCADLIEDKSDLRIALENAKSELEEAEDALDGVRTATVNVANARRNVEKMFKS